MRPAYVLVVSVDPHAPAPLEHGLRVVAALTSDRDQRPAVRSGRVVEALDGVSRARPTGRGFEPHEEAHREGQPEPAYDPEDW